MPVVGAVLHLEPNFQPETLTWLANLDHLTLGVPTRNSIPVVGTTSTRAEDKALWNRIRHNPLILRTELVFADFSDIHEAQPAPEVIQ